jgi:RimJ/RimL family protein N-acetyltransferase
MYLAHRLLNCIHPPRTPRIQAGHCLTDSGTITLLGKIMTTLRQLAKEDVVSYRRVRLLGLMESPAAFSASYAHEEKMSLDDFARRLEPTPVHWVVGAFEDAELVGVIGFMRDGGDKLRHKGFIWGMYVIPTARGRGVGRAICEEALRRIDALPGLRSVRLSVAISNEVALRLCEKVGFIRYGEEHEALCVDGVFHSQYHMVRKLDAPTR